MSDDKSWWQLLWDKSAEADEKMPGWLKALRAVLQTLAS